MERDTLVICTNDVDSSVTPSLHHPLPFSLVAAAVVVVVVVMIGLMKDDDGHLSLH